MGKFDRECAEIFLAEQGKIFSEPVASNIEEAEEFLETCYACVLNSPSEIRAYWEENGMDSSDMTDEEIIASLEVFALPSGNFLVIEA